MTEGHGNGDSWQRKAYVITCPAPNANSCPPNARYESLRVETKRSVIQSGLVDDGKKMCELLGVSW